MRTQTVNGVELAYVDRGSGPVVVLIHGFPLDHSMWDAQIDALSETCRVIAPDLRGFGSSQLTEGTVTMEQFADDLAALLDAVEIDQPVTLCGLSMGGYIAFQFWRRNGSRLRGLVLCDTRAGADTPEAAAGRSETAARVLHEGPAPLVDAMMPRLLAETTVKDRPEIVDSLRRMILSANPQAIAAAARGMAQRPDMTARLAEIDCPTLVVVGRHDALSTPEEMGTIARAIPGAWLAEIPEAGHMSPMENPAVFNAELAEFVHGLCLGGL